MTVVQLHGKSAGRGPVSDRRSIIAALDIGSSKISCLIGETLPAKHKMPGASEQTVIKCAEEIRAKFQELCLVFDGHEIHATISLGAAIFPLHGSDVDEVFVHADRAMYRAKQEGRNRVVVYSVESGAEIVE
jgi:predicted signal transduction protein with EAL and GGDEF domain